MTAVNLYYGGSPVEKGGSMLIEFLIEVHLPHFVYFSLFISCGPFPFPSKTPFKFPRSSLFLGFQSLPQIQHWGSTLETNRRPNVTILALGFSNLLPKVWPNPYIQMDGLDLGLGAKVDWAGLTRIHFGSLLYLSLIVSTALSYYVAFALDPKLSISSFFIFFLLRFCMKLQILFSSILEYIKYLFSH